MWFLIVILLLLLLLFSPVIRVWRAVRKFQKDYDNAMNQTSQQNQGGTKKNDEQNDLKERYRRYSDETGEYVSFEEMEGRPEDTTPSSEQQASTSNSSKYQEEIVSDAEFEDI